MTKPMNTIGRKTQRRKVALRNMERNNFKTPYYGRDKGMAILKERINSAPQGIVKTKKNRSTTNNAR